jgi:hypothetical protein
MVVVVNSMESVTARYIPIRYDLIVQHQVDQLFLGMWKDEGKGEYEWICKSNGRSSFKKEEILCSSIGCWDDGILPTWAIPVHQHLDPGFNTGVIVANTHKNGSKLVTVAWVQARFKLGCNLAWYNLRP